MNITQHCFALLGFACTPPWTVNAGFVVGEHQTLVIDTGANALAAATIYGYATAARPTNQLLVINTEQHLEHLSGNAYFHARHVPLYGHARIARQEADLLAEQQAYNACIPNPARRAAQEGRLFFEQTHIVNPDQPITMETTWDLGALTVNILLTPGHTPTNLSIYIPEDRVVFCGDCVVNGYLPNLECSTRDGWQEWLRSLARLEALQPQIIIPGHGHAITGHQITTEIQRIRIILQTAIQTGIAPTGQESSNVPAR
jgi:glyoxylase-like metal-dependent hydrolase (beta-lactamase superfamily II)